MTYFKSCVFCTCSNFQPSDIVETICVSSSSWHCSTRYTCFTGPWGTQQRHAEHYWKSINNLQAGTHFVWTLYKLPGLYLHWKKVSHLFWFSFVYLRCPVLVVPYPLFHQPHQGSNVVELGFLQNAWNTNRMNVLFGVWDAAHWQLCIMFLLFTFFCQILIHNQFSMPKVIQDRAKVRRVSVD